MAFLSFYETLILTLIFYVASLGVVLLTRKKATNLDRFLVADRKLSPWHGAFSIAVSWVWAPAIFIASLQSYQKGLPGAFWFIAPNIICFFVFAFFAIRFRTMMPAGYTFSHYIRTRFPNAQWLHLSFAMIALLYQTGAIVINAVAGGALLHMVSGVDPRVTMIAMVFIALSYCWVSGLRASVMTDILQMLMIIVIGGLLIPWAIFASGGIETVTSGLAGVTGEFGDILNSKIAYTMGIPITISLLAGPLSDQMFHQRALAIQQHHIRRVFMRGGLIFGVVPIMLSLLGFIGVTLAHQGIDLGTNPEMVGVAVIEYLLPRWALYLFLLMAFAGLCSTLDSAFCGLSAIGAIDFYQSYFDNHAAPDQILTFSRRFMVVVAILGLSISLLQPKLLWVFFIYGTVAATGFVPTFASVLFPQIKAKALLVSIWGGMLFSLPLSIYANISEQTDLIVLSSLAGPIFGFVFLMMGQKVFKPYDL